MAKFRYRATNPYGKEVTSTMESANIEAARAKLTAEGFVVLDISETSDFENLMNLQIGGKPSKKQITLFCRQFASVLEAGVTVIDGLRMVQDQTENKRLRASLFNVQTNVEKGETLANAMKMEGNIFPELLLHMVEAGEATGSMEIAFQRVALQFEKDQKIKSLLIQSMIYPIVVIIVAVAVVIILMSTVIPNFKSVFDSMDQELPLPTRIVMGVSDWVVANPILLAAIFAVIIGSIMFFVKSETGKQMMSRITLAIPITRNFATKSAATKFSTTMSTLIVAGVPMVEAVDIVADIMGNRVIRQSLHDAKADVMEGIPLSEPLERAGLFPQMLAHMVRIGEETGAIESMLDKVADYYELETENATKALTTIMEPATIIVLAVVVGGVIGAIVMPMMGMYEAAENGFFHLVSMFATYLVHMIQMLI